MARLPFLALPSATWDDDPQEILRAQVFVIVCGVFFVVIATGSLLAFSLEGWSWRRVPSLVNIVLLATCVVLSYRQRSIAIAAKLFIFTLTASAMAYAYQTGGVGGYGASFMLTMPFVAQLFSTRAVSVGVYIAILAYLWFLLADYGVEDHLMLMRTVFHSLTLTGLLGISLAFAIMAERARALLEVERAKADAANQAKSAFLANTSHEVRTPLNGILGMAQIMKQDALEPEQQERVDIILDSGETLLSVLNDVLDLSKIEAGRLEIAPAPNDLAHAIRSGMRLWEGKASEKAIKLELLIPEEASRVLIFDAIRVRQCLSNLVSNAIKFTHEGGVRVEVITVTEGSGRTLVTIAVSDSGIGLSETGLAKLFKPFSQADKAISAQYGGTGLGLTISKQLAELMDGDITVASTEGQGSTFKLTFLADHPDASLASADAAEEAAAAVGRYKVPSVRDLKVLLVDDNPVNRKVARAFLKLTTEQITEATNGADALVHLRDTAVDFDLVLLDMNMPVMDGPETVTAIRSEPAPWHNIPVIALTADAMSGDRERYLAMGLSGYVSKPIDQNQLLAEINSAIASRASLQFA